ncbi:MAG: hypothetical protein Q9168_004745 [Polycauliona sp. 1 TL-2023]
MCSHAGAVSAPTKSRISAPEVTSLLFLRNLISLDFLATIRLLLKCYICKMSSSTEKTMNDLYYKEADYPLSQKQAYSPYQEKIVDEKSIAGGLELDRGTITPFKHTHRQQAGLLSPSDEASYTSETLTARDSTPQLPPSRRSRSPRFWLIAGLGVFAITTTIVAIVMGVLFAKNRCSESQRDPISQSAPPSSSASSIVQTPKSSCSTLPTVHEVPANPASAINASTTFNLRCGHDYKLPLIMGIRTYTFENCIDACASQRTNVYASVAEGLLRCTAVAYKPDSGQTLTCWLKTDQGGNIAEGEYEAEGVDGAVVTQ